MQLISDIAKKIGLSLDNLELYGNYKAKINYSNSSKKGDLILVTSTNPTPYGEGKTTLTIGLNDSLNYLKKNSLAVLREPSLGPVFGTKGGATGGGKAIVEPSMDINLHFTGDFHAITSANNLLSAIIDNHIFQGNALKIKEVVFKRCLDINDRALRNIKLENRNETFDITPASEIMAIVCLAKDMEDLRICLGEIIVGYTEEDNEIKAKDLNCVDALLLLLKDAFKPNLVQSLYENPVIIHGGPFANIAHGCNSLVATELALSLADYVIVEAGFGSDMGALKFFDIKCRNKEIYPKAVIINTTIKSLKYNGENSLEKGIDNLKFHIDSMKKFNSNIIVSLNNFNEDTLEEIEYIKNYCDNLNVDIAISKMYVEGEIGCLELANKIINLKDNNVHNFLYDIEESLADKIKKVTSYLGATDLEYSLLAEEKLKKYDKYKLPICIAKTPYSITDNPKAFGYPRNFKMKITDIKVSNGAGFIVIYMGDILTMPGLSKHSNYMEMKF